MTSKTDLLISELAGGTLPDDAWKKAGFASPGSAAAALSRLASTFRRLEASRPAPVEPPIPEGGYEEVVVNADGASRGNPGPSSSAAVAYDITGRRVSSVASAIGKATNNVAEYKACLLGLRLASRLGARRVTVRMDSELVVRQLRGEYRIRNGQLRPLAEAVLREAESFDSCRFEHIPRSENSDADRLANDTLDAER